MLTNMDCMPQAIGVRGGHGPPIGQASNDGSSSQRPEEITDARYRAGNDEWGRGRGAGRARGSGGCAHPERRCPWPRGLLPLPAVRRDRAEPAPVTRGRLVPDVPWSPARQRRAGGGRPRDSFAPGAAGGPGPIPAPGPAPRAVRSDDRAAYGDLVRRAAGRLPLLAGYLRGAAL